MSMNIEDRRFLSALNAGSPRGDWTLPCLTRPQERARARARRNGWAVFDREAWAWRITDTGRAALNEDKQP